MATCQDVLMQAMRGLGVLDNNRLDAPEATLGMLAFNDLYRSMLGNGIGPRLEPKSQSASTTVVNGRRYLVGAAALTLTAPARPRDGDRFGFIDTRNGLSAFPLTISPNGQILEGVTSNTVVSTNGVERTYFYTSHSASWVKERDMTKGMDFPLMPEVRMGFTNLLSVKMAPNYGEEPSALLIENAKIGWAAIVRIYGQGGSYDPPVPL